MVSKRTMPDSSQYKLIQEMSQYIESILETALNMESSDVRMDVAVSSLGGSTSTIRVTPIPKNPIGISTGDTPLITIEATIGSSQLKDYKKLNRLIERLTIILQSFHTESQSSQVDFSLLGSNMCLRAALGTPLSEPGVGIPEQDNSFRGIITFIGELIVDMETAYSNLLKLYPNTETKPQYHRRTSLEGI